MKVRTHPPQRRPWRRWLERQATRAGEGAGLARRGRDKRPGGRGQEQRRVRAAGLVAILGGNPGRRLGARLQFQQLYWSLCTPNSRRACGPGIPERIARGERREGVRSRCCRAEEAPGAGSPAEASPKWARAGTPGAASCGGDSLPGRRGGAGTPLTRPRGVPRPVSFPRQVAPDSSLSHGKHHQRAGVRGAPRCQGCASRGRRPWPGQGAQDHGGEHRRPQRLQPARLQGEVAGSRLLALLGSHSQGLPVF